MRRLLERLRTSRARRELLGRLRGALDHPLSDRLHAPERLVMGRGSYGEPSVLAYALSDGIVRIGAFCAMAQGVTFLVGGDHRLDWVSTFPFRVVWGLPGAGHDGHPASKGDIVVGNDVWLGRNATILSGVRIGDGAAVAAEAVVTKDVRPYAVVAGNPAREVRRRFADDEVDRLLALRWWEWPEEQIRAAVPLLNGGSVDELFEYARGLGH